MEHRKSQATGQAMALGHDQLATMRGAFLQQVYGHLAAAIALFVLIQVLLYQSGAADAIARTLLGYNWLLVLGGFVVVGWLGRSVAYKRDVDLQPVWRPRPLRGRPVDHLRPPAVHGPPDRPGVIQSAAPSRSSASRC